MSQRLVDKVLSASIEERNAIYLSLTNEEKNALAVILDAELSNPWARYEHDPVGFIEEGLGETIWSKQREILESVRDNKRTTVPACHAPGKSHLAARAVAWWISVHPPGTAIAITTASTFKQVRNIMWAGIRRVHIAHDLPGEILTTEWKMDDTVVAYGFRPADNNEAAVQGIHAPHLLVVVDEAGGISDKIGSALEALMTGGHTRLLVLGNPPTDQEQTWFERICNSPIYETIPIGAYDTPNFTGEETGQCRSCPPHVEAHAVATHLVDQSWVDDVIGEFGDDSPFVEARVHARFPQTGTGKVIPYQWAELATSNEDFLQSDVIRLGVDIASDGGDEFVIAKADGYRVSLVHRSSGKTNSNAVDVAGVVMGEIDKAVAEHEKRNIRESVRVKIDTIGVGWGVVSLLDKWVKERQTKALIIGVNVAERPKDQTKFKNQRAEMWWNTRSLLQPKDDKQDIRLDVDRAVLAQLAGPTFSSDSSGRILIESKKEMKKRGVHSPDRAEAILLALYENKEIKQMVAPVSFTQSNPWTL
ncbi:hypothetical protein UFOVP655_48 [uncultured Caudovirales phage]|uniref:Terminase n=1 Tax=uncultured Caudovirales phage TaxID=2100421 RepID=A0A6J5NBR3_9CAUD|nr:hypothetical protein UFOVP655_48 [uncultured Caudovirales phage]